MIELITMVRFLPSSITGRFWFPHDTVKISALVRAHAHVSLSLQETWVSSRDRWNEFTFTRMLLVDTSYLDSTSYLDCTICCSTSYPELVTDVLIVWLMDLDYLLQCAFLLICIYTLVAFKCASVIYMWLVSRPAIKIWPGWEGVSQGSTVWDKLR